MKAQIFINGLHPELYMAVSLLTPNMLEDAYARAKAFENMYRNNPTHMAFIAQPIGYPTYLLQRMVGTPKRPITNTVLLRKKKNVEGREDTIGLGETEEIPPQDADMDNRNEIEDLDDDVQE
ncbi:3266_t:CDS:2, partial [Cetraspora pellucida]